MKNPNFVIVEHFLFIIRLVRALKFFLLSFPFSLRAKITTVWDSANVVILFAIWYVRVCLECYIVYVFRGLVAVSLLLLICTVCAG